MRKIISVVLFLIGIAGCATPQVMHYAPDQDKYLQKAMAEASDFTIPLKLHDQVWGRCQAFIGRLHVMKIQTISDYAIQVNVPNNEFGPTLNITQSPKGDSGYIRVDASRTLDSLADQKMERVLSYYMFYGDEPPPELITRLENEELGLQYDGTSHPSNAGEVVLIILGVIGLILLLGFAANSSGSGSGS